MARRSYIPQEIFWGHQFRNVVQQPGNSGGPYVVDLNFFHQIDPQKDMPKLAMPDLSALVVNRAKRTVPYPLLGENTLVLSDVLCIAPNEDGLLCLYCRVGDTYPNQMLEITAKMFLYRWRAIDEMKNVAAPEGESFQQFSLSVRHFSKFFETFLHPLLQIAVDDCNILMQCGYSDGSDRLHLRLPGLLTHVIDADSPLASWREPGGIDADASAEIVVVLNAYMNVNTNNILRQRSYFVSNHLKYGYGFMPMVKHPKLARDGKPRIRWQCFHDIKKVNGMEKFPPPPESQMKGKSSKDIQLAPAPESHANYRAKISMAGYKTASRDFDSEATGIELSDSNPQSLDRYRPDLAHSDTINDKERARLLMQIQNYSRKTSDAGSSIPTAAALHPGLPGPDKFREEEEESETQDFTVQATDLHRYSAAIGTDSIPKTSSLSFTPLPVDFREATAQAQLQRSSNSSFRDREVEPSTLEDDKDKSESIVTSSLESSPSPPSKGTFGGSGEIRSQDRGTLAGIEVVEKDKEGSDAGPLHFR